MHMSIRQYPIAWGKLDETLSRASGFIPLVRGMPGFVAYHVMDPGDTTLITVSVFETEAGGRECNRRATEWVDEFLSDLVTGPPRIMMGPVVVDGASAG
ncbi:MAG: hypothetical protein ABW277_21545 [Longimicrobiaceae bacterium]